MPVDSFKFLPRLIAAFYRATRVDEKRPIPWTALSLPIRECRFGLVTSAGIYHRESNPPFDVDKERQKPTWGDPTFRKIPANIAQENISASHLHINTAYIIEDANIVLPFERFKEMAREGIVGSVADYHYSFMGYQGYPPNTIGWEKTYGPQVAAGLLSEGVNCVLLTPA